MQLLPECNALLSAIKHGGEFPETSIDFSNWAASNELDGIFTDAGLHGMPEMNDR